MKFKQHLLVEDNIDGMVNKVIQAASAARINLRKSGVAETPEGKRLLAISDQIEEISSILGDMNSQIKAMKTSAVGSGSLQQDSETIRSLEFLQGRMMKIFQILLH